MQAHAFWRAVTWDRSDLLRDVLAFFRGRDVRFCAIDGVAVNAHVEPVVTLDLDLVLAAPDLTRVADELEAAFTLERFPHSINLARQGSDLRVQLQTDPRYGSFIERAAPATVLGVHLPVARVEDVLQGTVWAASDSGRRPSKRQKDLADIARLIEFRPDLRTQVPTAILDRLI